MLNDKLVGFYRSTFTDDAGDDHAVAVTQFEATHARKAFPCWDEPELKAVFAVTLVVPDELTAVSNAARAVERAGRRRPPAHHVRRHDEDVDVPRRVRRRSDSRRRRAIDGRQHAAARRASVPGKGHLTDVRARERRVRARSWFADYYGIVYPGDKFDLVAVPDFAFGAMENLGCITFREVLLLVDPDRSTQPELQNVADVIHHELAHMWFGDLVTMKWWNGIWLNEAFATFMEMKCTDAFRPEWERWVSFGLSRTAAFDVDSLRSTRPIEFEVVSPDDAEGMFDVLTYEKGAAVLRMLEQYLGEDVFRDGIRHYLVATSTRTPRRPTCGTPSRRRAASPSARSWTRGSSRAATRGRSRARRRPDAAACARNGSATPVDEDSDGDGASRRAQPTWAVPDPLPVVGGRAHRARHGCCSRNASTTSSCPSRSTGCSSTRAAPASTARATGACCATGSPATWAS